MIISIIVAMDANRGIGLRNQLPWKLSSDLKRFKQITMAHHLIMGRKTFESIGKPLPGRHILIVSRNPSYRLKDCLVLPSLETALETAQKNGELETFICGGASIYAAALPIASRLYLTWVHSDFPVDTYFPPFDLDDWIIRSADDHEADDQNEFPTTFQILERQIQPSG